MYYKNEYQSPIGELTMASDGESLVGLWIAGQKYFAGSIPDTMTDNAALPVFHHTIGWLNDYFAGKQPQIDRLPLAPIGSGFRKRVWSCLMQIPYGQTVTYGQIAKALGGSTLSAQAVGSAVGHNPISIIIPCHRVLGAGGNLTGYAGGIQRKLWLLRHEGVNSAGLVLPGRDGSL